MSGASEEPSGAQAEIGQAIPMAVGDSLDRAVKTQATEMVSHFALREVGRFEAEQRGQVVAEIAVGRACWQQLEQQQCAPQDLHLWIGDAKRGSSLRRDLNGTVYFLESFFGEQAVVADLFDLGQAAVGLKANLA